VGGKDKERGKREMKKRRGKENGRRKIREKFQKF